MYGIFYPKVNSITGMTLACVHATSVSVGFSTRSRHFCAFLAAQKLGRALAPIFARSKSENVDQTCGIPLGNACYAG